MNRRTLVKQVLATAAVGAVAPQVLAEPVSYTTDWITHVGGINLNKVVIGNTQYEIALDIADWTWKWIPVSGIRVVSEANKLFLKVIDTGQ